MVTNFQKTFRTNCILHQPSLEGPSVFDADAFVLDGGPAGLAAAIAARRRGFRVMTADADRPPIDKACGEGLMPDSLEAAGRLASRSRPGPRAR